MALTISSSFSFSIHDRPWATSWTRPKTVDIAFQAHFLSSCPSLPVARFVRVPIYKGRVARECACFAGRRWKTIAACHVVEVSLLFPPNHTPILRPPSSKRFSDFYHFTLCALEVMSPLVIFLLSRSNSPSTSRRRSHGEQRSLATGPPPPPSEERSRSCCSYVFLFRDHADLTAWLSRALRVGAARRRFSAESFLSFRLLRNT